MTNPYQAPNSQIETDSDNKSNRYAGFWARVAASLIDTFIWLIISLPLLYLIYGDSYFIPDANAPFLSGVADAMINWILPIFIIIGFWTLKQGTPGKILLKMKIVDAKTGERPTLKQWIIRYLGYIPAALILFLGFLWVIWDKKKQGWHDKLAGTVVVFSS
ncbi:MAG: RDD family protein [Cocleimonas sp.]|nr:RDD family protein [Cocleimonas sp.]